MTNRLPELALILGSGEVGTAVARECANLPIAVAIHCRRPNSIHQALHQLSPHQPLWRTTGDLAMPVGNIEFFEGTDPQPIHVVTPEGDTSHSDIREQACARLSALFETIRPKFVFDCMNLATSLTYGPVDTDY